MRKGEKDKLEKILNSYFAEIHRVYVGGNFREESFYSSRSYAVDYLTS
jgi:hypothetical protein